MEDVHGTVPLPDPSVLLAQRLRHAGELKELHQTVVELFQVLDGLLHCARVLLGRIPGPKRTANT